MPLPASRSSRSSARSINAWPGWVDALSSLVMVVIFLLMVFVLAQFYLATALTGRNEALSQLNQKVVELGEMLALERRANGDLRSNVAQLSNELQGALVAKEDMARTLAGLQTERDEMAGRLSMLSGQAGAIDRVAKELTDANKVVAADREKIDLQLREIASLQADLLALRDVRERLEGDVATLARIAEGYKARIGELEGERARTGDALVRVDAEHKALLAERKALLIDLERQRAAAETAEAERTRTAERLTLTDEQRRVLLAELGTLRDRSKELESRLADAEQRTLLAQKDIGKRDLRIEDLLAAASATQTALDDQAKLTTQSQQQIALLNQQMAALRSQITRLNAALESSEVKGREQEVQIVDLGRRLNAALATKVEELARYRSEFFGRLREVLGTRPDIRIVGDRFVFQSEVLFPTGAAMLEEHGKMQLAELARTLLDISSKIPAEVNWVLRVDGHTDLRPIATAQFPSNWELSTARALSVVRFLMEQGIPASRLAAAGFGEFQPLDPANTEDAYGRNRRIEIKLDQR